MSVPTYSQRQPIPGYPDYDVSDTGQVWSRRSGTRLLLEPSTDPDGYQQVTLTDERGTTKNKAVHHLVLLTFVGPRKPKQVARHLNGDPTCNHLWNLRWGTQAENAQDSIRHGTHHNARKTHCVNGHPFDIWTGKQRQCSTCRAEYRRKPKGPGRGKATHCKRGHEFTPENLMWAQGYRRCKECQRMRQEKQRERRRTAAQSFPVPASA